MPIKIISYAVGAAALGLAAVSPAGASPPPATTAEIVHNPDVDRLAGRFLSEVQAGHVDAGLDTLFATTSLWSGKTAERQAISAQITAASKIYGAIHGYELAQSTMDGTSAIKQFYLVRHDNMVTRWELDFVRTDRGWAMAYVGFDDQVRTWF